MHFTTLHVFSGFLCLCMYIYYMVVWIVVYEINEVDAIKRYIMGCNKSCSFIYPINE